MKKIKKIGVKIKDNDDDDDDDCIILRGVIKKYLSKYFQDVKLVIGHLKFWYWSQH